MLKRYIPKFEEVESAGFTGDVLRGLMAGLDRVLVALLRDE